MLKIIEVHTSSKANGEYIVLQNQGLVTVNLRGWAVCTDALLEADPAKLVESIYIFRQKADIKPYQNVVLFTGAGEDGWVPTNDGRQAYCSFWNRRETIWSEAGKINVLHVSSTKNLIAPRLESVAISAAC